MKRVKYDRMKNMQRQKTQIVYGATNKMNKVKIMMKMR